MRKTVRQSLGRALACGFILAALGSWFPFAASCARLPEHVLRLHVVANSDSVEDQAVKLKVRDRVLQEAARWYQGSETMEEASASLCCHLGAIQREAQEALLENGCFDPVSVQVTDMYFPTREYEKFSLPAGKYRTLRVTLGAGGGKNWWCVVFPALCLPAAQEEDVLSALPPEQRELVEGKGVRVSFKLAELYEELKNWLAGGD